MRKICWNKLYRDVEARAFDRSRLKMFENHLFAFPYYFSINSKTDEEKNAILGTSFSYLWIEKSFFAIPNLPLKTFQFTKPFWRQIKVQI